MVRFLYGLAALLALIIGAALVVPGLLDWSGHKPAIAAALERVTGQQVVIAGDVSVALLPTPALQLSDVRVPARDGAVRSDVARLKSLRLELALAPLLTGDIESRAVTLDEPELALEVGADGTGNWRATTAPRSPPAPARPAPGAALAAGRDWAGLGLDDTTIIDGRFSYRDARTGASVELANIDATVNSDAARGPMRGRGTAETARSPVAFEFRLGTAHDGLSHLNALVELAGLEMKAEVSGDVSSDPAAGFDGHVRLEGRKAEILSGFVRRPALRSLLAGAFAGSFTLEGDVAAGKDMVSADDFRLDTDNNHAAGSLAFRLGEGNGRDALTAALTVQKLDLDRWLRRDRPQAGGSAAAGNAPARAGPAAFSPPRDLAADVELAVEAIVLKRSVVRDLRANLRLVDGEVTVNQLTAGFPGGTRVTAFGFVAANGGAPRFDGTVEAASDNLRGLLDWLSIDVSQVPAELLRRWRARAKATVTPDLVRLDGFRTTVDLTRLSGTAALQFDEQPRLSLAVEGERFDLDSYLPEPASPARPAAPPEQPPAAERPAPTAGPARLPPPVRGTGAWDAAVEASFDSVLYRGRQVRGVELAARLKDGRLVLDRLHAADAGGSELSAKAEFGPTKPPGGVEASVELSATRPRGVLGMFGVALPSVPRAQGPLSLSARVARGKEAGVWSLDAQLALGDLASAIGGTLRYRAAGKDGPLAAELGVDRLDLDFLLALLAAQAGGRGDGDAPRTPSATAGTDVPGGPRAWSDTPFPPDLLQLPAAALTVRAGTLVYLGQEVENAELHVQSGGGLHVKRLSGRLHGGALALEGRIAETETPGTLAVTALATLDGADAGALLALRDLAEVSEAAVNLKLNIDGKGRSPSSLVADLTGKGRVWGQGGRLDGFDLARANQALAAGDEKTGLVNALAESSGGSTRISSFGGDFRLEGGALQTRSLRVQADGGSGEISGAFDLLRREVDAELRVRFAAFPDAPPILARVQGPAREARVVVDFNALQTWLKNRAPRAARPASN